MNDTNEIKDSTEKTQEFIDKFEKLAEEYNIEEYVATIKINDRSIMLWRPKNLNIATRIAKNMHTQLHNMVLMEIGDIIPPENY